MDESGQREPPATPRTAAPPALKITIGVLIFLIALILIAGHALGPALFFGAAPVLEGLIVLCGVLFFVLVTLCICWVAFRIFAAPRGRAFLRAARPVLIPMFAIVMPIFVAMADPILGAVAFTVGIGIAVVLWMLPVKPGDKAQGDGTDQRPSS